MPFLIIIEYNATETLEYLYKCIFDNKIEKLIKLDTMYFVCPQGHIRLDFETATEYDFICPECGEELEFFDNTNLIKQIKDDIKTVESNYKSFTKKVDA